MCDLGPTEERYPLTFARPDRPELRALQDRYKLETFVGESDLDTLSRLCA